MRCFHLAGMSLVALTAPATAQNLGIAPITLLPGEATLVRFSDGRPTGRPERGRAEWTPYTIFVARHFAGTAPPSAPETEATPLQTGDRIDPELPSPGEIRVRFYSIAGRYSLLVIGNGSGRPIAYEARITSGGRTVRTDVCVIPAGINGIEHWPYPIERIELTSFRPADWRPGSPVPCG